MNIVNPNAVINKKKSVFSVILTLVKPEPMSIF